MNIVRPGKLHYILSCISHLLDLCGSRHSLYQFYLLLANAIYVWQIYNATTIKSECVIAWKTIMIVEAAGLRGSER